MEKARPGRRVIAGRLRGSAAKVQPPEEPTPYPLPEIREGGVEGRGAEHPLPDFREGMRGGFLQR